MKKFLILFLTLGIFFSAKAQQKSVIPMMSQAGDFVNLIENEYHEQVVHLQFDVIAKDRTFYRLLYADVMYGFIVYGDENITDLKLEVSNVQNGQWTTDTVVNAEKGIVMLYFKPKQTDNYAFTITSKLSQGAKYGYYACLIFR